MKTRSISPNLIMSSIKFNIPMVGAYVCWSVITMVITSIMLLELKVRKRSLSIDFGLLRGRWKMNPENMTTKSKSLMPSSLAELGSESRISDAKSSKCLKPNCTTRSWERLWKSKVWKILRSPLIKFNVEYAGATMMIHQTHSSSPVSAEVQ